jgi:hypothetical protein
MHRRGFFGGLMAFLGLGTVNAVADIKEVKDRKTKGFIVLTLNVGMLPPFKAEAFCERTKKHWKESDTRRALDEWEIVVMPVRPPQETKIEFFPLDNLPISNNVKLSAEKLLPKYDNEPFVLPDKQKVQDHVLLMLGMDQRQLDLAWEDTKLIFDMVGQIKGYK